MSKRISWQSCLLIATFLPTCWLQMMVLHEFGHVVAGWLTGGTIEKVVLHPFAISRTDLVLNPHPLVVCWAGPVLGCAIPHVAAIASRRLKWPAFYLVQFFAGFCFIANGTYIGIGSFDGIGDAGDLLRLGSPTWLLWAFGIATIPTGFWLWHGLGTHFGLRGGQVSSRTACLSAAVLLIVVMFEIYFSSRF